MLIDKAKFYTVYGWFFSPRLPHLASRAHAKMKQSLGKVANITPAGPKLFGSQEEEKAEDSEE
jgi:hypothetical protein